MAIHPSVPGITVSIEVGANGQSATEYDDPDPGDDQTEDGAPIISKYIESVDDTTFAIKLKVSHYVPANWLSASNSRAINARPCIDGVRERGRLTRLMPYLRINEKRIDGHRYRNRDGTWTLRKFQFSPIETVDERTKDQLSTDVKVAKHLGIISVEVWLCDDIERSKEPAFIGKPRGNDRKSDLRLHEKALKGRSCSHNTTLSAPQPCRGIATRRAEDIRKLAVFNFKYRSRESLYSEFVIPRPDPGQESLNGLTREELVRELREARERLEAKENLPSLKRERSRTIDLDAPRSSRPLKVVKLANGSDAIDLTDD